MLIDTMKAYRDGCNLVSEYIYTHHSINEKDLNRHLYIQLRDNFGLKSQMAQSVIRRTVSCYRIIHSTRSAWSVKPLFKRLQYELPYNRDYSLSQEGVSVNTINGRIKRIQFQGMEA